MRLYTKNPSNLSITLQQWNHLRQAGRHQDAWHILIDFLRPGYGMAVYILLYLASFHYIETMTRLQYIHIHVALDDLIPFCEAFVLPYLIWFPYMILSISFLFLSDRQNYHKSATMLYIGMTLFIVVSLFWPNIQYLRPEVMPRDNICTRLVASLYRSDTPTNLCPSIHVFNTLVAMTGVHRCRQNAFARNRLYRTIMYITGILIILSTMFIKQHSVFDVVSAFVCYGVSWFAVYGCRFSLSGETNSIMYMVRSRKEHQPRRVHG